MLLSSLALSFRTYSCQTTSGRGAAARMLVEEALRRSSVFHHLGSSWRRVPCDGGSNGLIDVAKAQAVKRIWRMAQWWCAEWGDSPSLCFGRCASLFREMLAAAVTFTVSMRAKEMVGRSSIPKSYQFKMISASLRAWKMCCP